AEKDGDRQKAGGEHVRVFAEEEQGELHAAVFRVVSAHQLLLAFGQVEGHAVALGKDGGEEEQGSQRLKQEVPAVLVLVLDHAFDVERAGNEDDAEYRHAHRNLVADELGTGAEAAEEAVLVIGGPTAQDDRVGRQTADGEDVDDADI